jgi:hypothetical protein
VTFKIVKRIPTSKTKTKTKTKAKAKAKAKTKACDEDARYI